MNEMSKEFYIMMILLFVGHYAVVDFSDIFLKQYKGEDHERMTEIVLFRIRTIQFVINVIVYVTLKKYLG